MQKLLATLLATTFVFSAYAKENSYTANFVNEVKKAADSDGQLSEQLVIECPVPSASGTFLITKATYDFSNNLGVYVFKNGQGHDAKLDWIGAKTKGDDLSSDEVVGFDFGLTMPGGQFFITVMKNGKVKVGVNKNGTSGVKEITCKVVVPD
ncbi:hypothetical protein J3D56_003918 [Erwinia persicina]|uniref:hypothetical protein n=1 Tax=Erwinia persicina TaxID=55211 RepID=UPI0020A08F25|nr:hypothetical protein [Erwinia persicina]MCP1440482.1 hypothetical protein [Erwinia persicina]